jgi:eukaryotic-like serine/threonine-protein kinase
MKKGDVLNGYTLTTDPQNGGGHSEWAFAQKGSEDYFFKRFLKPAYPVPGGPGSKETKELKRKRSEEFERQQRLVIGKLRPIAGAGGNLVITKEFFREQAFYYKVTEKVAVSGVSPGNIAAMDRDSRIMIMLTAAKSLDTLHKAGLVHGDVKPDNLLVQSTGKGGFAIKVIDFDNCFLVHDPPVPDQLVGDPVFYSPELLLYQLGKGPGDQLDEKNDVFALGLVFWQYLTGERPKLPDGVFYPAEALNRGTVLTLPKSVKDRPLTDLVHSMVVSGSAARPSMSEVHAALKAARKIPPDEAAPPRAPKVVAEPSIPDSAVMGLFRGRMSRPRKVSTAEEPASSGKAAKSGLSGRLRSGLSRGFPVASGFVPGEDGGPAADPAPPESSGITGRLTSSRPVMRPVVDPAGESAAADKEDETTKGVLKGRLLKKKEGPAT